MNLPLLLVAALAVAFIAWSYWRSRPAISPEAVLASLKAGTAILIDVREKAEWTSGTAKDAALLPLSDLRGPRRQWSAFLEKNRGKQLLLYCRSGVRSSLAAAQLGKEGYAALNAGSLGALERAGCPLVWKGK